MSWVGERLGWGRPGVMSGGQGWDWEAMYSEVQGIMGNGHMGTPL